MGGGLVGGVISKRGRGKVTHDVVEVKSAVGTSEDIARSHINSVRISRTDRNVSVVIKLPAIDIGASAPVTPRATAITAYFDTEQQLPSDCVSAASVNVNLLRVGCGYRNPYVTGAVGEWCGVNQIPGLAAIR